MSLETAITTIFSFFIVSVYACVFIYLPGYSLVRPLKISRLEKQLLALITGVSLYSLTIYTLRYFSAPFFVAECALLVFSLLLLRPLKIKKIKFNFQIPKLSFLPAGLIITLLITSFIHAAVLIQSGIQRPEGIEFVELSYHDSMQHVALIKRLYRTSEFAHPSFGGAEMKNYHYLVDTALAGITRFEGVTLFDVYYRLYPIFVSVLFSLSLFALVRKLSSSSSLAIFSIWLTIFGGNASYFVSFIREESYIWGANAFMINPIVDILQNPASIIVLAQTLWVVLLLLYYQELPPKYRNWILASLIIIAGSMIGFKAWGGLLIMAGLGVVGLWQLITARDHKLFLASLAVVGISAALLLPGFDPASSSSPVWSPGWLLRSMVNDADRWNSIPDLYQEETFRYQGRWLMVAKLYFKWTLIYFLGNFWVRAGGILLIAVLVLKTTKLKLYEILIIVMTALSLAMPLLFFQGQMAYDIEQFAPYSLLFAAIYTSLALGWLIKRNPYAWALALLLLCLSLPSNYTSVSARTFPKKKIISNQDLETYARLAEHTTTQDQILLHISHRNVATLEFPAFTDRDAFYAGRTLAIITGEDPDTRKWEIERFFLHMNTDERRKYLEQHNLKYMFLYEEDKDYYRPKDNFEKEIFSLHGNTLYTFDL